MANIVDGERSIYVASFPEKVDEDILEELFTQVGPVTKVLMKKLNNSETRFALIEFEDEDSVLFAIETLDGIKLFNTAIVVKPRNSTQQEEKWRRAKPEIERRQRSNPIPQQQQQQQQHHQHYYQHQHSAQRDHHRERDNYRQSYDRDGRSAPSSHHRAPQPYAVPDRSRNRPQYNQQYSTPSMPHTQFINAVLRQNSTPESYDRHQSYQQPRRDDWRNDQRTPRSSYDDRRSHGHGQRGGGSGHRPNYGGSFSNRR